MTDRDDEIRRALEGLNVPPEPPAFFDELWERVQARQQASVRRWRRIALGFAGVAAAAVASAAVLAASPQAATSVIDVRGECLSQYTGGLPTFQVDAGPDKTPAPGATPPPKPPPGFSVPPDVIIETGFQSKMFTLASLASGYTLDRRQCTATHAKVSFTHKGLPFVGSYAYGGYTLFSQRCLSVARFVFRVRMTTDPNGIPTRAEIEVVRAKGGAPLIYVDWTPAKVVGYASARCRSAIG